MGTGRTLELKRPGVPVVLICLAQETEKDAAAIEDAVRATYPSAKDVLVAHVVDLRRVPALFRRVAEGVLEGEYKKAVAALREGETAFDDVVILPDWHGEVASALQLPDPASVICGAVIRADGRVAGTYEGAASKTVLGLVAMAVEDGAEP